ncbi:MAG: flagellar basal-body rod protein FlgF [Hyphomicrobiales bacterium]|nr:flagellar basal-body rod protein FlgF [Hyphomicrobiales bacterium]
MENAQIVGLSRQITLQHELDVIANNLANMNTTGFKGEALLFEEYLSPDASMDSFMASDRDVSYVWDVATVRDFSQGAIFSTGNPFEVALNGEGFLVVETPDGERYTRNGAFVTNEFGELVTNDGYRVLGEGGGPIVVGIEDVDIAIAGDGTISTATGVIDRLRLVEFEDPQQLEKIGNSLYAGESPRPAESTRVVQGAVEKSNVVPVVELSRMIEVTRTYDVVSRLMRQEDELRSRAIERLGTAPA